VVRGTGATHELGSLPPDRFTKNSLASDPESADTPCVFGCLWMSCRRSDSARGLFGGLFVGRPPAISRDNGHGDRTQPQRESRQSAGL